MANVHSASAYLLRFEETRKDTPSIEEIIEPQLDVSEEEIADLQDRYELEIQSLRRAYDELLATQQDHERHIQEAIENARSEWLLKESESLVKCLKQGLEAGFVALRNDVARILEPFLGQRMSDLSVSELITVLRQATVTGEGSALRIEGPKDLIETISASFVKDGFSCEIAESDAADVRILLRATNIQTRIDEWFQTLQKPME